MNESTTESGNHKRRSTDRRNGAGHAFLRQSVQLQSVQLWLIFSTFGLVNDRRGMYRDRNDLLENGVWVSGLHAPVFSSRHLLATVISRACIDPREGCSPCHVSGHGKHQPRTTENILQPHFGTLHWSDCCCVWGHNILSEWRSNLALFNSRVHIQKRQC